MADTAPQVEDKDVPRKYTDVGRDAGYCPTHEDIRTHVYYGLEGCLVADA